MLLQHQNQDALEINDSVFNNITLGSITIRKSDSVYQEKVVVQFFNITVTNNDIFIW